MGLDLEYLENDDNLNEFERENQSMNSAYKLLIGGVDNWELEFNADHKDTKPDSTYKSINRLISYFENREEYDKCNNLKKLKIIRDKTWI